MDPQSFVCEKCSGTKQLFIEKRARALLASATLVALALAVYLLVPEDSAWRTAVVYLGAVVAIVPLMSLVRIQCLHCEPEWKHKTWG